MRNEQWADLCAVYRGKTGRKGFRFVSLSLTALERNCPRGLNLVRWEMPYLDGVVWVNPDKLSVTLVSQSTTWERRGLCTTVISSRNDRSYSSSLSHWAKIMLMLLLRCYSVRESHEPLPLKARPALPWNNEMGSVLPQEDAALWTVTVSWAPQSSLMEIRMAATSKSMTSSDKNKPGALLPRAQSPQLLLNKEEGGDGNRGLGWYPLPFWIDKCASLGPRGLLKSESIIHIPNCL